jgi:hypothetical protein
MYGISIHLFPSSGHTLTLRSSFPMFRHSSSLTTLRHYRPYHCGLSIGNKILGRHLRT